MQSSVFVSGAALMTTLFLWTAESCYGNEQILVLINCFEIVGVVGQRRYLADTFASFWHKKNILVNF